MVSSFGGLNSATRVCVPILSFCIPIACKLVFLNCYYCCYSRCYYYKCSCKCWKCYGLSWLSSLHKCPSPPIFGFSSTFRILVSCFFLNFCFCFFICLSYGNDIYGTSTFCLLAYTITSTTYGATLPFIIF